MTDHQWQQAFDAGRADAEGLVEALERAFSMLENVDTLSGVCCCGDDMDHHSDPMSCGHSPVDSGSYAVMQWVEDARRAITKYREGRR